MILFGGIKVIKAILAHEERKIRMLWMFSKLSFFRYIYTPKENINVLGYKIKYTDYRTFYDIFIALFIQKDYFFQSHKKTPLIIDCGSNIGLSILFFKKMYPDAKIVGFEPDPETVKILKTNIKSNNLQNVQVIDKAIDSKKGKMSFYIDEQIKSSPGMSLYNRLKKQTLKTNKINVDVVLLSAYISSPVDFLKIDIEGSESAVIFDLDKTNKFKFINEMVIEYHHNTHPKNKLSELLRILEKNNFEYEIASIIEPPFKISKSPCYNILIHAYKKP